MKTKTEIQAEAEQLSLLGRRYQAANDQNRRVAGDAPTPEVLRRWPEPVAVSPTQSTGEQQQLLAQRERQIEVAFEGNELNYRLVERDAGDPPSFAPASSPLVVVSSRSVYDVLRTGYELEEEDRLAAELEPFAEWSVERDVPADDDAVTKVETIVESNRLPHADRLRTKAEIIDFLSGRLEPSEFIAHAIDRQLEREEVSERREQRNEVRLTIDEP